MIAGGNPTRLEFDIGAGVDECHGGRQSGDQVIESVADVVTVGVFIAFPDIILWLPRTMNMA